MCMCIGGSSDGGGSNDISDDSDADIEETRHHYHVDNFNDENHQPPWDVAVGGSGGGYDGGLNTGGDRDDDGGIFNVGCFINGFNTDGDICWEIPR